MTAPLNLVPSGLLDLFAIRSGGRYPQVLLEQLMPHFDLTEWYHEMRVLEVASPTSNIVASVGAGSIAIPNTTPTNIGDGTDVTVPQTEMWILLPGTNVRAVFSTHTPQSIRLGITITRTSLFRRAPGMTFEGFDVSNAGVANQGAWILTRPCFVGPGFTIRWAQYGTVIAAGGQIDVTGTLRLVRLRI